MLVFSRQKGEGIVIGDNIHVTVEDIRVDRVRLGISAPTEIPASRKEVYDTKPSMEDLKTKPASQLEGNAETGENTGTSSKVTYEERHYRDDGRIQ